MTNRANVVAAHAALKSEVDTEQAQLPALLGLMSGAIAFVRFNFGRDPEALSDFGLKPPKTRTPLTAEQKAAAAAKGHATSCLRRTD